jgi:hypothetical protein
VYSFNEDQDFFLQLARSIVVREPVWDTSLDQGIAHQTQATAPEILEQLALF